MKDESGRMKTKKDKRCSWIVFVIVGRGAENYRVRVTSPWSNYRDSV
jgi:hypothetical protein